MAIVLFAVAIFLLWFAGIGLYFLLTKKTTDFCVFEVAGLGFLLGTIFIALGSISLSFFLPRGWCRSVLTLICLGLGGYGMRKPASRRSFFSQSEGTGFLSAKAWKIIQILILLVQLSIVGWVGMNTTLSWDGLVNWEVKGKIFYEAGGITKQFLQSEAAAWSKVDYPPLLPLNQAWTYGFIGAANQNFGKAFCIIFYLIAVLILLSTGRKNFAWLLFFIPLTWLSDGSSTSGHADFSVAVFYLAAAKLLSEFAESGEFTRLKLLSAISLGLVFVKQDSIVLLMTLLLILPLVLFIQRRRFAIQFRWILVLLPAIILSGSWKLSMRFLTPYFSKDFHLTLHNSWQVMTERLNVVGRFFFWEFLNPFHWGTLWIIFLIALGVTILRVIASHQKANFLQNIFPALTLVSLVLVPLSGDFLIYLFIGTTADWLTMDYWLNTSAARLILQSSLVALLCIQELSQSSEVRPG